MHSPLGAETEILPELPQSLQCQKQLCKPAAINDFCAAAPFLKTILDETRHNRSLKMGQLDSKITTNTA